MKAPKKNAPALSGKALAWVLAPLLLAATAASAHRGLQRLEASRLLRRVEMLSMQGILSGAIPRPLFASNLRDLRRAAALDPLEAGVPLALGSQYLVVGRPREAEEAYRRALVIEPRPEIYLNLGKAQRLAGKDAEAAQSFERALRLSPRLEEHVPRELHPSSGK